MNTAIPFRPDTGQRGVYPRLDAVVRRHVNRPWQGGGHGPTEAAFGAVLDLLGDFAGQPVILDSGCGSGESTRLIAGRFPDSLVIGIDRSRARLARQRAPWLPYRDGNAVWVRAELAAFWRLALRAGWRLKRHYLLYPNPWPKAAHFRRRWHGHPVFPTLLALGGTVEMRTNWLVYAREFVRATQIAAGVEARVEPVGDASITSPFERKYRRRGDALYRVRLVLESVG